MKGKNAFQFSYFFVSLPMLSTAIYSLDSFVFYDTEEVN